ncbi:hypothetical protein ACOME3_008874 [Neoechinorhynchus agilis]
MATSHVCSPNSSFINSSHIPVTPDYESFPAGTKSWVNCTAGAIAGIGEHCLVYPLDFAKTRLMMLGNNNRANNMRKVFKRAFKHEGYYDENYAIKPLRGVSLVFCTSGPAHALYFGAYEAVKAQMQSYGSLGHATGAVCATLLHDAVMVPSDTIKQRIQASRGQSLTILKCFSNVLKTEGVFSLYRSYATHVLMTIPFQVTHFVTYEIIQDAFNPHREYRPLVHVIGGGVAGMMGAAITNPLDVCKTLINTQQSANGEKARNLRQALTLILNSGGPGTLLRGVHARMIFAAPSAAISWSVYEMFKHLLGGKIIAH